MLHQPVSRKRTRISFTDGVTRMSRFLNHDAATKAWDDATSYKAWTNREREQPQADKPKLVIAILLSISLCAWLVGTFCIPGGI